MENEQKRPDDGATVCETVEVGQTNAKAKKAKRKWTNNKNQWKAWLYLLPALILLLLFTVWPIINTVRMSLLKN